VASRMLPGRSHPVPGKSCAETTRSARGACLLRGDATLHDREIASEDTGTLHGRETASVEQAHPGGRTVSSKALPALRGASARPCRSLPRSATCRLIVRMAGTRGAQTARPLP
jgi:hypothetical protein